MTRKDVLLQYTFCFLFKTTFSTFPGPVSGCKMGKSDILLN